MSFRSATLFIGVWRIQVKNKFIKDHQEIFSIACKVFAIVFPGFILGVIQAPQIASKVMPFMILCNLSGMAPIIRDINLSNIAPVALSLIGGFTFLALTLYKFIESRKKLSTSAESTKSTTAEGIENGTASLAGNRPTVNFADKAQPESSRQAKGGASQVKRNHDLWLIIRFTIAFVLLL